MAAYYHGGAGTDVQAGDGLQTLYLMNPSYAGYGDAAAAPAANMVLLNSAMSSISPGSFAHHHNQQQHPAAQHFVGIPLQPPQQAPPAGAAGDPRLHYNLWAPAMAAAADVPPQQQQGLSLSLSSRELQPAPPVTVASVAGDDAKYAGTPPASSAAAAGGGGQGLVMSSKYLKAAQQLLDEVVSVGKGCEAAAPAAGKSSSVAVKKTEDSEGASGGREEDAAAAAKRAAELSTAERQELQMKKAKLVNMLDEVEQRYRQYHQQMQMVVSSFEAAAGAGAARTYTALALRTISRQFRSLRDAIAGQLRAASRALGEDADGGGCGGGGVGSRLRYIDHQLRQQRALQQLGMMQHSAWRPQRGLPERSVSILRAWLFEHFLHPYPKDSDKIILAKQTGLTRSQVSNWFINARVRLWKPMVEEMYLEETKDQDGAGDDNSGKSNTDNSEPPGKPDAGVSRAAHLKTESPKDPTSMLLHTASELGEQQQGHGAAFYDGDAALQPRPKKARTDEPPFRPAMAPDVAALHAHAAAAAAAARHEEVSNRELLMTFMEGGGAGSSSAAARDHQAAAGYSLFSPQAAAYQFGSPAEHAQFAAPRYAGNGVSLTLGLPHGEQPSFLAGRLDMGGGDGGDYCSLSNSSSNNNNSNNSNSNNAYDMNMQSRKSFAAQLMRDFVA